MKKSVISFIFILLTTISLFAEDGFFLSAGISIWPSLLDFNSIEIEPNEYPLVDNAILYDGDTGKVPLALGIFAAGGYSFGDLRVFFKTRLSTPGNGILNTMNGTSATYSGNGSTSSFSAYDHVSGGFSEADFLINAGYDFLIIKEKIKGFGVFAELGAGIGWIFGANCKFLEMDSWSSSYEEGSQPSVSSTEIIDFGLDVSPVVPLLNGIVGLRYYIDDKNAITFNFGLDYYIITRIPDNKFYFQDEDGNAIQFSLTSSDLVPSIVIGYNWGL